ncbi:hypothetical protein ACTU3I_17635 [Microbacterium sp. RD1]|uniref:hypothetical protein n=1 Tax=Microbacterium sp. RD1 TaxID=3457313 RepID=UPI003FA536FB
MTTPHPDASTTTGATVVETRHAILPRPESFAAEAHEGADVVLAFTGGAAGFRPNLVLTSVPSTAPLTDASLTAVLAAPQQHPRARVLSCDAWDLDPADGLPRARRIVFAYRADEGRDVLVHKWVWATGAEHVHLSASCLPSQAHVFAPVFSAVASGVELTADPDAVRAAARAIGAAPLQPQLSERVGFPLEDVSSVPVAPFVAQGALVSIGALQPLLTGAERGRIGAARGVLARSDRAGASARLLADAGWIDDRSRLTPLGAGVADILRANRHVATITLRRAERSESLTAYAGQDAALVVCGAGLTEPPLDGPDSRRAAVVPAEHLPAILAAWAGVRPFWSVTDEDERVTPDELEAHVAATGGDGSEAWTGVLVRTPQGERYDVLSPSRGFLRIGPPTEAGHAVGAEPSGALFDLLLDACDRAFSAR